MYFLLADAVVVFHFLFIAFVVAGGLFVLRRPWVAWVHLPAAFWGSLHRICRLDLPADPT